MTSESGKTRRRYGAQFKAMVLAQCDEPGMSVAQVAMSSVTTTASESWLFERRIPKSLWAAWETNPPDFIAANPWARTVFDSLGNASAIAPCTLGVLQFDTARVEWIKYLSGEVADAKTAMTNAQNAAYAVYQQNTATPTA